MIAGTGAIAILTGFVGFCPMCAVVGRKLPSPARAIQSLPDHYREVILLRDIEELSIDEISGVLALTRESVKARIHRARLMIREYLIRD